MLQIQLKESHSKYLEEARSRKLELKQQEEEILTLKGSVMHYQSNVSILEGKLSTLQADLQNNQDNHERYMKAVNEDYEKV